MRSRSATTDEYRPAQCFQSMRPFRASTPKVPGGPRLVWRVPPLPQSGHVEKYRIPSRTVGAPWTAPTASMLQIVSPVEAEKAETLPSQVPTYTLRRQTAAEV